MPKAQLHKTARPLGLHTSIAGGLHLALSRAKALGCSAVQIFSHNPRGWNPTALTPEDVEQFRALRVELGLNPVVVHASYLVNIASPKTEVLANSVRMVTEELVRASALGADYLVVHSGSSLGVEGGIERAAASVVQSVERARKEVKGQLETALLIEATSGKRGDVAARLPEMARLMEACGSSAGGVCLDTCHLYAAGYDFAAEAGLEGFVEELRATLGLSALKVLHLNDSKGALGSGTDRHEHLGSGQIGLAGLGRVLRHPALAEVPAIMETPRESDEDDLANMAAALRLMGR